MTKDARGRLLLYSQLFYLLQTNPRYLATLVFIEQPLEGWATAKVSTFLQHVIQSTYNFASNAREAYLQLQLFRTALKKEITEKVTQVKDFITGNPTVTKLVITHHRNQEFAHYLSDMLSTYPTAPEHMFPLAIIFAENYSNHRHLFRLSHHRAACSSADGGWGQLPEHGPC